MAFFRALLLLPLLVSACAQVAQEGRSADALSPDPAEVGLVPPGVNWPEVLPPEQNPCLQVASDAAPDCGLYWAGPGSERAKVVAGHAMRYFDPARPTVVYVHGWQRGSMQAGRRENFLFEAGEGQSVWTQQAWVDAGWNVGVFYWDAFADEDEVKDAEGKIWSALAPRGMRWRDASGAYRSGGGWPSAGELFFHTLVHALSAGPGTTLRVVGHSLGNQMALRLAEQLGTLATLHPEAAAFLPARVALLDPFWSKGGKDYLSGAWPGERCRAVAAGLRARGALIEMYRSTAILDLQIGDFNEEMQRYVALVRPAYWYLPAWDLVNKHTHVVHQYFWSYAFGGYGACITRPPFRHACRASSALVPSAPLPDDALLSIQDAKVDWIQREGRQSVSPSDDVFEVRER